MRPFKCDLCNAKFTSKHSLNGHIAAIHERKKPFKCDISEAKFTQKSNLDTHIATVHERKILILRPNENGQFNQAVEMKVHVDAVHEGDEVNQIYFLTKGKASFVLPKYENVEYI